jgi:hypothetical protein
MTEMKKVSFPILLTVVVWILIAVLAIQDVTGRGLFQDDLAEIETPESINHPAHTPAVESTPGVTPRSEARNHQGHCLNRKPRGEAQPIR